MPTSESPPTHEFCLHPPFGFEFQEAALCAASPEAGAFCVSGDGNRPVNGRHAQLEEFASVANGSVAPGVAMAIVPAFPMELASPVRGRCASDPFC